ncbi:MAG: glycosyl hydrolase, partial [Pseudomonadota bacterium]
HYDNPLFVPMIWGGPPPGDPSTWPPASHGVTWDKGCANARRPGDPDYKTWKGCTPEERLAYTALTRNTMTQNAPGSCGRAWLIYNEPDLPVNYPIRDSADLDPAEAAAIYDQLVQEFRQVDPTARFYCCGTVANHEDVAKPAEEREYTHPWLDIFLSRVVEPLDGFHIHNYAQDPPESAEEAHAQVVEIMDWYREYFDRAGYPGLPITITESGNFPWPDALQDEQAEFMELMATWLNQQAGEQDYAGAAWFVSRNNYTAPCQFAEPDRPVCTFSSRTVFQGFGGRTYDSLTAYGRSFNYDASDPSDIWSLKRNGGVLSRLSFYPNSGGPCAGTTGANCDFDTRTVAYDAEGQMREKITRLGTYYEYLWDDHPPTRIGVADLTHPILHYADPGGPCAGKGTGECRLDTHTIFDESDGRQVESITVGDRYFNRITSTIGVPGAWSSGDLDEVEWYAPICSAGPADLPCKFDTRTVFWNADGDLIDSITVQGYFYNLRRPGGGWPPVGASSASPLTGVERFVKPATYTALYYPSGVVDPTWEFPRRTLLGEQWLNYLAPAPNTVPIDASKSVPSIPERNSRRWCRFPDKKAPRMAKTSLRRGAPRERHKRCSR